MKLFPTLMTPASMAEARVKAMRSFEHDQAVQCQNLRRLPPPPDSATEKEALPFLKDIDNCEPAQLQSAWRRMMEGSLHPRYPPPTTLPCANVQVEKYAVCKNSGKMACSACKLVSYCSKVSNEPLLLSGSLRTSVNACFRNAKKPTGSSISEVKRLLPTTYGISSDH